MADGRHLENHYDVITLAADNPLLMKFGVPMENHMRRVYRQGSAFWGLQR